MRRFVPAALLFLLAACAAPPPVAEARRFPIEGQLLGVQLDTGQVVLKHGEVVGYMGAMTMPFPVPDTASVRDRRPGDLVTATLVVEPNRYFLEGLRFVGTAPLPAAATARPVAEGVHIVGPGDPVPGTVLTDHTGRSITLTSWAGRAGVVTFIYTRCPLPDFCPLMDRRFAEIEAAAAADAALRGRVQLLSVSFDPAFDTPKVLAEHAAKAGAGSTWRFATAPPEVVDRFAAEFGVNVIREADQTITHNLRTAVIGPDGRVVAAYSGNDWTADALVADLRRALAAVPPTR
ncbi:MAG: SCO family protein [Acidobacteriota bacterium]